MYASVTKHLVQQHHNHDASLQQLPLLINSSGNQKQSSCRAEKLSNKILSTAVTKQYQVYHTLPERSQLHLDDVLQLFMPTRHPVALFLFFHTSSVALKHLAVVTKFLCKNIPPPALESVIPSQTKHSLSTQAASSPSAARKQTASPEHPHFVWGLAAVTHSIVPIISP